MEWPIVKLGDISELITKGTTPTSVGFKFTETGINFIKVESITKSGTFLSSKFTAISEDCNEALKRSQLKVGDVLFSIAGALGRTALVTQDILPANTNQALAIIRLKSDLEIDKRFLMLALTTGVTLEQVNKHKGGVAQQNLSLGQLKTFEIPLPPIQEQKRIVAILDQAFADIDKARALTEENLKNARELFESYLQQVFSQRGEDWSQRTLGDLGKVSMCKRILKKQTSESGDIPFFKIGTFGKKPDAYISKDIYDDFRAKYSFPKTGDILISASGTIGRRVIYDGEPAYFQDSNIVWIDNDESLVLNDYLYHFYSICDWNPSKGATISRLYNDDLRAIKISFPSIQRQRELVNKITVLYPQVQDLQILYKKKLTALEELKKSLLQKAFSGELTKNKQEAA